MSSPHNFLSAQLTGVMHVGLQALVSYGISNYPRGASMIL